MPSTFRRVAVIGKLNSPGIAASLRELHEFLLSRKCEVLIERETAVAMGLAREGVDIETLGRGSDLAIVVGGDGTMLAAARGLAAHEVPLIGVNQGRVGFMTDIALSAMKESVGAVLDGHYTLATPTGSTAYSLSAQGPILHPAVPALALVPLSPQTLSARPVSVSDRCKVEIVLVRSVDARAHFDGFALADMVEGDRLILKRSADSVHFVHPAGYDYFRMLREKLRWSQTLDLPGSPE
jgi:NAD+ kinase